MPNAKERAAKALSQIERLNFHTPYPDEWERYPIASYYELSNSPGELGDDVEYSSSVSIQIDLWTETTKELEEVKDRITQNMQKEGFTRQYSADMPEPSIYKRKTMRFIISL